MVHLRLWIIEIRVVFPRKVCSLARIKAPDYKLIAGDRLVLKYTGTLVTLETSPGQTYIEGGELKDYYFVKTDIFEEKDATAEAIKGKYNLRTENIILDDEGHFASIDQYEGTNYYLTFDKERVVPCPEGANNNYRSRAYMPLPKAVIKTPRPAQFMQTP